MKLNRLIPVEHERITQKDPDHSPDTSSALSQYIVFFNIGGIWNIIAGWLERDMQDDAAEIKKAIIYYLQNIGTIDLRNV